MIAKRLELLIAETAHRGEAEMTQRFQKLRDFGSLPRTRGKNAEHLSPDQIIAGLLSILEPRVGHAGIAAKVLKHLKPVGGAASAFTGAETLCAAMENLLVEGDALDTLLEVRVSYNEVFTNSNGLAEIRYLQDGQERSTFYVRREAVSLFQPGAEKTFDPRAVNSTIMEYTIYLPRIFKKIARIIREEESYRLQTTI